MTPAPVFHHWVRVAQSDLPRPRRVLTEPSGLLPWSERDRTVCGLVELHDSRYAVISVDTHHDAIDVLVHEARNSGFHPTMFYEVDRETLDALHQPNRVMRTARRDTGAVEKRNDRDIEIDDLFSSAIAAKCTDIHLVSESATGLILFRVHGGFVKHATLKHEHFRALCHAIYLRTDSETKTRDWHPEYDQEASGNITLSNGAPIRFRYQSLDRSPAGFKIVLRLLDDSFAAGRLGFSALGYTAQQIAGIVNILNKPRGVTLLSGPVNSGKSTTLVESYQYLRTRHGDDYNIHTLEHPVEYRVPGITQSNVRYNNHSEAGQAWTRAMSALMRMDVNCIGLGEIRDRACADISQQLVDTGHKLLASIHAGDPWDAADRFIKWGCNPESVWDTRFLSGVVSQELVALICPHCAVPYLAANLAGPLRASIDAVCTHHAADASTIRVTGPGCEACHGLGRIGRTVVAEILDPTDDLMALANSRGWRTAFKTWSAAGTGNPHNKGYRRIHHAIDKVLAGLVCPVVIDRKIQDLSTYVREIRRHGERNLSLVKA